MPFKTDLPCSQNDRNYRSFEVGRRFRGYDLQTGAEWAIAPTGTLEVGELIRLIGGNFDRGPLPPVQWQTGITGTGTVAQIDGELILSTGVTPDSTANIQSINRSEFVTATFNKAHLAFEMEDFLAPDVIREFGLFEPVTPLILGDGVFFRNNSGSIQTVRRRGGVDVEIVDEVDFNGGNDFIKDNSIHVYEIVYNAGSALFFQDRKLITIIGSPESVAYDHVHLYLGASIQNINGNTTDNTLKTRGFSCSRIGSNAAQPDSITVRAPGSGLLKSSPGVLESILITEVGTGGAQLAVYDNNAAVGIPVFIVDLTINSLFDLNFRRRMNNGIFYVVSGNGFEAQINWR